MVKINWSPEELVMRASGDVEVPRHEFVPLAMRLCLCQWTAPIGHGQTISPPFIVAFMTRCWSRRPTIQFSRLGPVPVSGRRSWQTGQGGLYHRDRWTFGGVGEGSFGVGVGNVHVRVGDGISGGQKRPI
jgi:protein-L-isoaspartate(D-aspartate) O-methyltransferase